MKQIGLIEKEAVDVNNLAMRKPLKFLEETRPSAEMRENEVWNEEKRFNLVIVITTKTEKGKLYL